MRTLWRGIVRTIFWSFERGSWPYDLMVVAIVMFVLLTPRRWFHDQPRTTAFANSTVELIATDSSAQTHTYRIDALAIPYDKRATQENADLDAQLHDVLAGSIPELKNGAFTLQHVDPTLSADGSVVSYNIVVHP